MNNFLLSARKEQQKIKTTMALYGVVIFVIVFSHSTLEGIGFHLDYTISRYLGMEAWSAILFLITTVIVLPTLIKFILKFKVEHKMGVLWMLAAFFMLGGLFGLSICPIGLYDNIYGEFGIISILHKCFSATMFASSITFSALSFLKFKEKTTRLNLATFTIYGAVVALLYVTNNPLMMNLIFLFEGVLLVWIFVVLLNLSKIKK